MVKYDVQQVDTEYTPTGRYSGSTIEPRLGLDVIPAFIGANKLNKYGK